MQQHNSEYIWWLVNLQMTLFLRLIRIFCLDPKPIHFIFFFSFKLSGWFAACHYMRTSCPFLFVCDRLAKDATKIPGYSCILEI